MYTCELVIVNELVTEMSANKYACGIWRENIMKPGRHDFVKYAQVLPKINTKFSLFEIVK